jgi:hypothetical protein
LYTFHKWVTGERSPNASVLRLVDVLGTIEALAPALHESFIPPLGEPKVPAKRGRKPRGDSASYKASETFSEPLGN